MVDSWSLKEKEEVRPATFIAFNCASEFNISSAMPSPKYAWSLLGLMSRNGSTAMEGVRDGLTLVSLVLNQNKVTSPKMAVNKVGISHFVLGELVVFNFPLMAFFFGMAMPSFAKANTSKGFSTFLKSNLPKLLTLN